MDNFTNDSAMMIAHERALESLRDDSLFQDPFAKALAGRKGGGLSETFGQNCTAFELPDWPEFHKMWTAVRTKFIDDHVTSFAASGKFQQLVNLGAGMDTRAYRLECYKAFTGGCFEVDMEVINANKAAVFKDYLGGPTSHCPVNNICLDFLHQEMTLATELIEPFDISKPTVFVSEGLVMYLGAEGKLKLLRDVSAVAAPGSSFILQFMDPSESEAAKTNPAACAAGLSADEAVSTLSGLGWGEFQISKFGDQSLNFGRYPTDKFEPCASFSFLICVKSA
jgi:methyltransferase (TIGR00027 family)